MKIDTGTGERAQIKPLSDILRDVQHGEVLDEASVMFADLVLAVVYHRKKGTLRVDVEVAPFKGNPKVVQVSAKASAKPPASDPVAAIFYPDEGGNLHRDDPKQAQLPLHDASDPVARPDAYIRT